MPFRQMIHKTEASDRQIRKRTKKVDVKLGGALPNLTQSTSPTTLTHPPRSLKNGMTQNSSYKNMFHKK